MRGLSHPYEIKLNSTKPVERLLEFCELTAAHGYPIFTYDEYGKDVLCKLKVKGLGSVTRYFKNETSFSAYTFLCGLFLDKIGLGIDEKDQPLDKFFRCDKGGTMSPMGSELTVEKAIIALSDIMVKHHTNEEKFELDPGEDEYLESPPGFAPKRDPSFTSERRWADVLKQGL